MKFKIPFLSCVSHISEASWPHVANWTAQTQDVSIVTVLFSVYFCKDIILKLLSESLSWFLFVLKDFVIEVCNGGKFRILTLQEIVHCTYIHGNVISRPLGKEASKLQSAKGEIELSRLGDGFSGHLPLTFFEGISKVFCFIRTQVSYL